MGKPFGQNVWDGGFDAERGSAEATYIADPNPQAPKQTASAPSSVSGGSGTAKVDKSNSIALQLAGLGAVDQQQSQGLSAVDTALNRILGLYGEEAAANEGRYKTGSETNIGNRETGRQAAMVNGAQGRRSLFGTLSSIGALSGDGITLANNAVRQGVNTDLKGTEDAYSESQTGLDDAIGLFRQQDKQRREMAGTAAEDARTNVRNQAAKNRQQFYTQLVNDYSAMGNAGEARRYNDLAKSLYGQIAETSVPSTSLGYTSAAYNPGAPASYTGGGAPSASVTGASSSGLNIPGLIVSNQKKKQSQGAVI